MIDIVERLREKTKKLEWLHKMGGSDKHILVLIDEAANEIERLRNIIYQYRDDLQYPPSADSIQRRLKMIDDTLEKK